MDNRLARVLGTSISTVRRLLNAETDLRNLAVTEVGHRRRRGRYGRPPGEGFEAALWLLRRMIPDSPIRIAEELVWWRVHVAVPTVGADGAIDPVVAARAERDEIVAGEVAAGLALAAPTPEGERLASATALVHALLEGVGVATCLGRVGPEEAVGILRSQLTYIVLAAEPGSS